MSEHALTLTSEDGEMIWIRRDAAHDEATALEMYRLDFGLDEADVAGYEPAGVVLMESVPNGEDPDWHEQVLEPSAATCEYWRFTA